MNIIHNHTSKYDDGDEDLHFRNLHPQKAWQMNNLHKHASMKSKEQFENSQIIT